MTDSSTLSAAAERTLATLTGDDPVVAAHEWLPGLFVISGPQPISIRDQFIRAKLLVDRLVETGRLTRSPEGSHPSNEPYQLLVVGGGGAGVTAAITAAKKGVKTLLVEKEKQAFGVQKAVITRYVCPTQYDWPLDHYAIGRYPYGPPKSNSDGDYPHGINPSKEMPLQIDTKSANGLALSANGLAFMWEASRVAAEFAADLTIWWEFEVRSDPGTIVPEPCGNLLVTIASVHEDLNKKIPFAVIIWAAGFGREDTEWRPEPEPKEKEKDPPPFRSYTVPSYVGRKFWSYDHLREPNLGFKKVLILGSGDGALQDFIRFTTGRDLARDVLAELSIPHAIVHPIQSAEDRFHRGVIWGADKEIPFSFLMRVPEGARRDWKETWARHSEAHLAPYRAEVEAIHKKQVEYALNDMNVLNGFKKIYEKWDVPRKTVLAYRGDYLIAYFGLNRFLTLLIGAYFEKTFKESPEANPVKLLPRTNVKAIIATDGTLPKDLWEKHKDVFVNGTLADRIWRPTGEYKLVAGIEVLMNAIADSKTFDVDFIDERIDEEFNLIIIRFGLNKPLPPLPSSLTNKVGLPSAALLLPYHLPKKDPSAAS